MANTDRANYSRKRLTRPRWEMRFWASYPSGRVIHRAKNGSVSWAKIARKGICGIVCMFILKFWQIICQFASVLISDKVFHELCFLICPKGHNENNHEARILSFSLVQFVLIDNGAAEAAKKPVNPMFNKSKMSRISPYANCTEQWRETEWPEFGRVIRWTTMKWAS